MSGLIVVEAAPVHQELLPMECSPFEHQRQDRRLQFSIQNPNGIDLHLTLRATVAGVEMGRFVVEEVHPNDDAKEARDFRHPASLGWAVESSSPAPRETVQLHSGAGSGTAGGGGISRVCGARTGNAGLGGLEPR